MPTLKQLQMYKNLLKKVAAPTEQDVAHMIAQRHAALPTAQGGLGLPAANTPMQRAAALGYDLPAYRGTNVDEASLYANTQQIPGKVRSGTGAFMSENPQTASSYAGRPGGNVMPVMVRSQGMPTVNAQGAPWSDIAGRDTNQIAREALAAGQPGVRFQNVADPGAHLRGAGNVPETANNLTVFNPADVRSRFAAFDPMKRESEDLLHAGGGRIIKAGLDMLPGAARWTEEQLGKISKYFDESAIQRIKEAPYGPDRSTVLMMPTQDFLSLAQQTKPDPRKMEVIRNRFAAGDRIPGKDDMSGLPYLDIATDKGTARVRGHEGRHRAMYLQEQGVNEIPVRVESDLIRWGRQTTPEHYDYIPQEKWPTQLIDQDKRNIMPFPFTREGAYSPTIRQAKPYQEPLHPVEKELYSTLDEMDRMALAKEFEEYMRNLK